MTNDRSKQGFLRGLPLLALIFLAACAGNKATTSPDNDILLPGTATFTDSYSAMGRFADSRQLLLGEARGFSNGLIVIVMSSEPQIVDAFFENWNGTRDFDRDAFVNDLMHRDLMLLDLQACFMGLVRDDYAESLKQVVPDGLKDEIVYLGTMSCIEDHKDMVVLLVQDREGIVKGFAGKDGEDDYLAVMINGSRDAFTRWSLDLEDDETGSNQGKSSNQSADEPDV